MKLEKRKDGWWITGVPLYSVDGEPCDAYGPYTLKADAADDMRGVKVALQKMADDKAMD